MKMNKILRDQKFLFVIAYVSTDTRCSCELYTQRALSHFNLPLMKPQVRFLNCGGETGAPRENPLILRKNVLGGPLKNQTQNLLSVR